MKDAVIFDIDGTLCDTCDVDDECFRLACREVLGVDLQGLDWSSAPQVTDEGLARWLWVRHHGRLPSAREVDILKANFIARLQHELALSPGRFSAIDGARHALAQLSGHGWACGIATGGWAGSARLKLGAAGIPTQALLATSDDSPIRLDFRARLVFLGHRQRRQSRAAPTSWRPSSSGKLQ